MTSAVSSIRRHPAHGLHAHNRNCARAGIQRAPRPQATSTENDHQQAQQPRQKVGLDDAGQNYQQDRVPASPPQISMKRCGTTGRVRPPKYPCMAPAARRTPMTELMAVSVRPNSTEMREAVNEARQHVARLIVGAQPVSRGWVAFRRCGHGVIIDRLVAVMDGRPDHPAVAFLGPACQ